MFTGRRITAVLAALALLQLSFGSIAEHCREHGAGVRATGVTASEAMHAHGPMSDAMGGRAPEAGQQSGSVSSSESTRPAIGVQQLRANTHSAPQTPCDHAAVTSCDGMLSCSVGIVAVDCVHALNDGPRSVTLSRALELRPGNMRAPVPPPPRT